MKQLNSGVRVSFVIDTSYENNKAFIGTHNIIQDFCYGHTMDGFENSEEVEHEIYGRAELMDLFEWANQGDTDSYDQLAYEGYELGGKALLYKNGDGLAVNAAELADGVGYVAFGNLNFEVKFIEQCDAAELKLIPADIKKAHLTQS